MVQFYVLVTDLGEVCFKWFILPRSARTERAKTVMSSEMASGSVQTALYCVSHLGRISYTFDNVPYFGGIGKFDYRCSLGFLSLSIIIVVILGEMKRLLFRIISGKNCVCYHY